ncbi:nucleotide exchange factor GrpE [Actinokineospora inagensis]|uniref:nucleotide exchange factor GrpE n=1 Tax=Actinokineospora inagensis TaxID=103730 RepID=UPI000424CD1B|nr:nucleotide exchange factor GrpE [Actinokineospora inagensis]
MSDQHAGDPAEEPQVVVRDRRRIDPETGQVRAETGDLEAEVEAEVVVDQPVDGPDLDPAAALKAQLDERTADLQRLQAEYLNYRKRVERDREAVIASAKASVVTDLLSVLDDVERANAHGDLTGAFKAVAEKLAGSLQKAGLDSFGHEGEPFDPSVHEAVQHNTSPEVTGPTVTGVLRRGYRFGDRVVRAALVAVTDAESAPAAPPVEES